MDEAVKTDWMDEASALNQYVAQLVGAKATAVIGREFEQGTIFIRQMLLPEPNSYVRGHGHNFGHTTYIVKGSALVLRMIDGVLCKRTVSAGEWLYVEAGVEHAIIALEGGTLGHCIYSHRNHEGEVVPSYEGWTPAYV